MLWALLPAAGVGRRFGSRQPKQFLQLGKHSVLQHSLNALLSHPQVAGAVVCLHPDWMDFPLQSLADKPLLRVAGGRERANSVLAGLHVLPPSCNWVLVHDAARPCLPAEDLHRLITARDSFPQGALLAAPVRDTMKRGDAEHRVTATVERARLWHALTPQMFPKTPLTDALTAALASGLSITDESSAMEAAGMRPGLVPGSHRNIKITHAEDLALAAFYLEHASC